MSENRIRVNAKTTAKGLWQLDVTVEINNVELPNTHPDVLGEIQYQEKIFRENDKRLVDDG